MHTRPAPRWLLRPGPGCLRSGRRKGALWRAQLPAQHASGAGLAQRKEALFAALGRVPHRGIYGTKAADRDALHACIAALEELNPLHAPAENLATVDGSWRVLYSTIAIKGNKRVRLGLKDLVDVGDSFQLINVAEGTTVNRVEFTLRGLGLLRGALTLTASFRPVSERRVSVATTGAALAPPQLQRLFEANLDLLLSIFDPGGWLDITFVDEQLRVGRDDKGHVFLLERCPAEA